MTDRPGGRALSGAKHDLRSFLEHQLRIAGQQADQLPAIGCAHRQSCQRALADEIRLKLTDRPTEADIIRGRSAVGLLADDDVALLGSQHVHGLGAIGGDAVRGPRLVDRRPDRQCVIRRYVDFEPEFAGEADAKH